MNIELSDDAVTFGSLASRALEAAGGDELLRRAERDPRGRLALVPLLDGLGAWDLDPHHDADELEAAAALCRSVGHWAAPYPVAERLSRPRGSTADGLVVVPERCPAAPIAGLGGSWVAVTMEGRRSTATATAADGVADGAPGGAASFRASGFVTALALEPLRTDGTDGADDVALGLVLPCWTLLGMLDRALALTRAHVLERRQFGQRLADFQGVQFQLTDAEVERAGAEELGKYALWSLASGHASCVADALAFRLATLEAAGIVFRVAHQLHGAIGFCDETVLSWVSRASAPLRRLPFGAAGTVAELTRLIGRDGLPGLFGGASERVVERHPPSPPT